MYATLAGPPWAIFVAGCFAIFALRLLYQGLLHPLRKYPGPWLCKVSRIPITLHLIRGTQAFWICNLHEKYGHVVRIAPDALSFTDERAWTDILGSTPAAPYGMPQDTRLNELIGGKTISADPSKSKAEQKHTQMRKAFAPGLTKAAIRQQAPLIEKHVDEFIDEMRRRGSGGADAVDLGKMYNFAFYDIFSDLFVGDPFNLFTNSSHHAWVDSTQGFGQATTIMAALQKYTVFRYLLSFFLRRYGEKYRDAFIQPCVERFDRRAADETSTRLDLFYFATKQKTKDENRLSIAEMRTFSPFLMMAGGETSASALSALSALLLHDRDRLVKLVREVRNEFPSPSDPLPMERLLSLPYLSACINETLRVYPPLAAGVDHVVPSAGAPIAGEVVPGGTFVLVAQYAAHRHSRNFHRPDDWLPERWLPGPGVEFAGDHHHAFRPFSVGPHSCFGQDLAHYVMRLTMCKLLLHFDLEIHPDSETWLQNQKIYFGWMRPEEKVYLVPRKW